MPADEARVRAIVSQPTRSHILRKRARNVVSRAIGWLHVEEHGKYSVERLVELHTYSSSRSSRAARAYCLLVLVATPLPALILNCLIDIIPLSRPDNTENSHNVFWARLCIVGTCFGFLLLDQYRQFIPELAIKMTTARIWLLSSVVGCLTTMYAVGMSFVVGFPIPFVILFDAPVFLVFFCSGVIGIWWRELLTNKTLRVEILRASYIFLAQLSLAIVYPAFTHFFGETTDFGQTAIALLLPLMKMAARAVFSSVLRFQNEDMRPEVVVFNVEVFHALFVSCCMQSSTSIATTVVLTMSDALETLLSLRSLDPLVRDLRKLDAKLQKQRPLTRRSTEGPRRVPFIENALLFVVQLEGGNDSHTTTGRRHVRLISRASSVMAVSIQNTTNAVILPGAGLLVPKKTSNRATKRPLTSGSASKYACEIMEEALLTKLRTIAALTEAKSTSEHGIPVDQLLLTTQEQQKYVTRTLQLFHVTDFILLTGFAEVTVAVIYAVYLVAVYYLPNRAYYERIATMTEAQLWSNVGGVLRYAVIEFLSFLFVCVSLQRKLGISPLLKLSFIVRKQRQFIHSKLMLWVLFAMSSTLEHFGSDYSFQFAWLQRDREANL